MPPVPNTFDNGASWGDVQRIIGARIYRKFPRVDEHIREDAVGDAVLELGAHWRNIPSSQSDGHLTFNFALQRGEWSATQNVINALHELNGQRGPQVMYLNDFRLRGDSHTSSSFDDENRDDEDLSDCMADFVDPSPGPEELMMLSDESERARRVLAALPPEELREFFNGILGDETQQEIADRVGITQQAVSKRHDKQRRQLQQYARKFGFDCE